MGFLGPGVMVRKAGGKLSTKDLGIMGDHREATVGVAKLLHCWNRRMRGG